MNGEPVGALSGVKIIDLTEARGLYAGKMLADLGADVIKVEHPNGSAARHMPPFKNDSPGLENSLYFLNFNTNKRGITLDITKPRGMEILTALTKKADVLIEDFDPGSTESKLLDYQTLSKDNERLIMASITGFGQTGPYRMFKAPDIVSFAAGGMMNLNGPKSGAPVVAPCEQTHHSSSIAAVFGINTALFLRLKTGKGQYVDVSAHEVTATYASEIMTYSHTSRIGQRTGSQFGAVPGRIYPCKDGHVHILTIRPNHWLAFKEVLGNPDVLMSDEWNDGTFRNNNVEIIDAYVTEFSMQRTKMEITNLCQAKGIPCTPVNTPPDFAADPHIKARGVFTEMDHPVIGVHPYLAPPYRLEKTPSRIRRSAPLLGQHNKEVYGGELGFSDAELNSLKTTGII